LRLQTKVLHCKNEYFCLRARQLYYYNCGRVKGFCEKTTHLIVTIGVDCYKLFLGIGEKLGFFGVELWHGQKSLTQTLEARNCNDLGFTLRALYTFGSLQ
jgi:hypothetical protein